MARNRLCRSVPGFSWRRESAGGQASPPQYLLDWYCKRRKRSNAGVPGAKPPAKLTYSLPLPAGKGVGGMGERKHTEGRDSRRPKRQAPLRIPKRQGQPTTSRASPPPARDTRPCSGAARVQPRGCKGRSPLHKKTKNLPLPGGEERSASAGRGDGGRIKAKGRGGGRQTRQATLRIPERQGQPTTQTVKPPITPAPHIPPAGRRQCGRNPAGRRDSRRTPARPRRRKWRAEQYREHG